MAHDRGRPMQRIRGLPARAADRGQAERMRRPLRVLYIAYPLLRLSDEIAGGAEQVLLTLAQEMSSAGHDVTIAAAESSNVPGRLLATGAATSRNDDDHWRNAEHEGANLGHRAA